MPRESINRDNGTGVGSLPEAVPAGGTTGAGYNGTPPPWHAAIRDHEMANNAGNDLMWSILAGTQERQCDPYPYVTLNR